MRDCVTRARARLKPLAEVVTNMQTEFRDGNLLTPEALRRTTSDVAADSDVVPFCLGRNCLPYPEGFRSFIRGPHGYLACSRWRAAIQKLNREINKRMWLWERVKNRTVNDEILALFGKLNPRGWYYAGQQQPHHPSLLTPLTSLGIPP
jgi:hypothetical protein